eukprot:CAMPEP_0172606316 /NCGR_PEP_ID=MMETSP1068-20121228/26514_1 /TAXON_ID=35684 /ORGANISM="Pseudopedinella elastica, Strain CCMP716" /LENGTH=428 /DNA_ID=CAMNT_0013408989 /DNA_START=29 /DNA_END=1315 /DNA_ORIENTATION=+
MEESPARPSVRSAVPSFKVMDVMARAAALEAKGRKVYHLEVGQPQSGAAPRVCEAAQKAITEEKLGYTLAKGLTPLRRKIVEHYSSKAGVEIPIERVVVTTGSSGGFLLVFHACFDAGDHVAVGMTCYPCYRNILNAMNVVTPSISLNAEYKITARELGQEVKRRKEAGLPKLSGFIQSSPANPTGAMLTSQEVRGLCQLCDKEGIWYISDEIYHGISYGKTEVSAVSVPTSQGRTIVVNSFSKYYSMTGWRLGWLVLPESLCDAVNRLQQNMFINAPTLSQIAAEACFEKDTDEVLQAHIARYAANREVVLAALAACGITDVAPADGAFYAYADLGEAAGLVQLGFGTEALCAALLEDEGVAITPGTDFEDPKLGRGQQRIRLSFPGATEDMEAAMEAFKRWWPKWNARVASAVESQKPTKKARVAP